MKKLLALSLVLVIVISAFAGCGSKKSESNTPIEYDVTGTGTATDLTVYLFDRPITVGKTTLKELYADKWGREPESWSDVDLEKELEYKTDYISNKKLEKGSIEIIVTLRNLTDTFAKPEDCTITSLYISGTASMETAGFSFFNGTKIQNSTDAFENVLKQSVAKYHYKNSDYGTLSYVN